MPQEHVRLLVDLRLNTISKDSCYECIVSTGFTNVFFCLDPTENKRHRNVTVLAPLRNAPITNQIAPDISDILNGSLAEVMHRGRKCYSSPSI